MPKIHGYHNTRIHRIWAGMKTRCLNPNDVNFKLYGGKGITVCERWLVFVNFLNDMESTYFEGATLERIDINKGYSPENVRWATWKEQARNRSTTKFVTYHGVKRKFAELCEEVGLELTVARSRLDYGWSVEDTFDVPVGVSRPKTKISHMEIKKVFEQKIEGIPLRCLSHW